MATPNPIQRIEDHYGGVGATARVGDDLVLEAAGDGALAVFQVAVDGTAAVTGTRTVGAGLVVNILARVGPGLAVYYGEGMST